MPSSPPRPEILIVEDDDLVMGVVLRALRKAGYAVCHATTGDEALALFESHGDSIRGVYLDLSLPTMPGVEVLAALRARSPSLPVVLTSGFDPRVIGAATLATATAFLAKPFRSHDLVEAMRRALAAT